MLIDAYMSMCTSYTITPGTSSGPAIVKDEVLVDPRHYSTIIGSGGTTLNALRELTGTDISVRSVVCAVCRVACACVRVFIVCACALVHVCPYVLLF